MGNGWREYSPKKILSGWDEPSSSESNTEWQSNSVEKSDKITHIQWTGEERKMKKLLNMWLKKHFIDSEKKEVVGLKMNIHQKRVQFSRKQ